LANINPFDQNADGCKIPDSNTYPSTSIRIEDEVQLTTDATFGGHTRAFRPYLNGHNVVATTASANSWTWTAAYGNGNASARLSSVTSNYALVRPVAHGIRITSPLATTTAAGYVHVCVYAQSEAGSTWALPLNVSQLNNCMFYQRFPLSVLTQRAVTVVNKFLDSTSGRYFDPNTDMATPATDLSFQTEGWATILVTIEGAGLSQNCVNVETIIHMEATPLFSGINSASPAAPFNISSLESVSRVAGHTPAAFLQGEEQSYLSQAAQALGQGAQSAFGDALPRYAYGFGRAAAGAALRYAGNGIPGVTSARLQSGFRGGLLTMPNTMYLGM
jgi:hypothetical protein